MNATPTLTVWLQLLGLLAAEIALVVAGAALLQRVITSAAWRRTLWQVCLLGVLVLPAFELTGTARGLAGWIARRAEPQSPRAQQNAGREDPLRLADEFRKTVAHRVARNARRDNLEPADVQSRPSQLRAELPASNAAGPVARRAKIPDSPAAIEEDSCKSAPSKWTPTRFWPE